MFGNFPDHKVAKFPVFKRFEGNVDTVPWRLPVRHELAIGSYPADRPRDNPTVQMLHQTAAFEQRDKAARRKRYIVFLQKAHQDLLEWQYSGAFIEGNDRLGEKYELFGPQGIDQGFC